MKDYTESVHYGETDDLDRTQDGNKYKNIIVKLNTLSIQETQLHFVEKGSIVDGLRIYVVLGYFVDEIPD